MFDHAEGLEGFYYHGGRVVERRGGDSPASLEGRDRRRKFGRKRVNPKNGAGEAARAVADQGDYADRDGEEEEDHLGAEDGKEQVLIATKGRRGPGTEFLSNVTYVIPCSSAHRCCRGASTHVKFCPQEHFSDPRVPII